MYKINDNYQKLPGSYLFSTIAKKVNAYSEANPDKKIIRLGIGDVTQPPSFPFFILSCLICLSTAYNFLYGGNIYMNFCAAQS